MLTKKQLGIQRLEAERERRIAERLERGEAVRVPPLVVGVSESIDAERARRLAALRGETREVIFGDGPIWGEDGRLVRQSFEAIVTGVPRSGRDAEAAVERLVQRAKESGYPTDPIQAQAVKARETQTQEPAPEPEPEPERHYVHVEIRPASENDPGQIIEGRYAVIGSLVQVWDLNGKLLGSGEVHADEDPKSVARKILRAKSDCGINSFYGPLRYPRGSMH
jgi:hypothetical protein